MSTTATTPALGVLDDSGLHTLAADVEEILVETPFGDPSGTLVRGTVDGRRVVFLPRHGKELRYPAHKVNYRANLWALAYLGVRQVLAPCVAVSLRAELRPGAVVLPDRVVDRTTGRHGTYDDSGAVRPAFTGPYCPGLRETLLKAAAVTELPVVDGGTTVVVDGPRSPTTAETRWYAAQGWSLADMTGLPEAALAGELGLCYLPVALVTGPAAERDEQRAHLRALVRAAAPAAAHGNCRCGAAHDGEALPLPALTGALTGRSRP